MELPATIDELKQQLFFPFTAHFYGEKLDGLFLFRSDHRRTAVQLLGATRTGQVPFVSVVVLMCPDLVYHASTVNTTA